MYVSLDLETTGFDPVKDKIIEFGAVKFDDKGTQIATLKFFCNPGFHLPDLITFITHIEDKDLKEAGNFEERIPEVEAFLGDLPIIGHNIKFDIGFLEANGCNPKNPIYDTFELAGILLPSLPSYSLEILSDYLDLSHEEKHRALDDAIATMELFLKLREHFKSLPPELIKKIHSLCQKSTWPARNIFLELSPSEKAKKIQNREKQIQTESRAEDATKILSEKKSALFEVVHPYENLVTELIKQADKDTYISLPYELFREMSLTLPEEVAKIDLPKNYLSLNKLEKWEQQENFAPHELITILKTIIWSKETKTGLLSELNLFREERMFRPLIESDNENDYFVKKALDQDKKSPAIFSHEFITKAQPEIKKLIIVDFEKFCKSLFWNISQYSSLQNLIAPLLPIQKLFPENESIKSLISKAEILFGLIGVLFDQCSDHNIYKERGQISNLEIAGQPWQNAVEALNYLISVSQELSELKNEQTLPYLQLWKENLKTLESILKNPDLHENMIWTELDEREEVSLKKIPFSIKTPLRNILDKIEKYAILSETLDQDDNAAFTKNLYGLDENLPLHKLIPKYGDTEISIIKDAPEGENDHTTLPNYLINSLNKEACPIALILNSRRNVELFTGKLSLGLKDLTVVTQLTGSINKLSEKFKQCSENGVLLLTPNAWEKFSYSKLINTLIIHKIPFDAPSDPYLIASSRGYKNSFVEFQIPMAIFNLKKIIYQARPKKIIIMDSRIVSRDYGQKILKHLENISTVSYAYLDPGRSG